MYGKTLLKHCQILSHNFTKINTIDVGKLQFLNKQTHIIGLSSLALDIQKDFLQAKRVNLFKLLDLYISKLKKKILKFVKLFRFPSQKMFMKKLPQVYQKNSIMSQMAKLCENKKVLFSASVCTDNGKTYVIKKTSGQPVFDKDRPIYSMIRGIAKTLISSDNNLKSEKDTFKVNYGRGDKDIEKMYEILTNKEKQKVFVMSHMKKDEIASYINSDMYELIGSEVLKQHQGKEITLKEVLQGLVDKNMVPILIQCGPNVMKDYLEKVNSQKGKNLIELVAYACFQGKMKKQCIGEQYQFDEKLFKKVWESDKIDVKDHNDCTGQLYYKVYQNK